MIPSGGSAFGYLIQRNAMFSPTSLRRYRMTFTGSPATPFVRSLVLSAPGAVSDGSDRSAPIRHAFGELRAADSNLRTLLRDDAPDTGRLGVHVRPAHPLHRV